MSKLKIIFEIANNHQGSINHFNKILDDLYQATLTYKDKFDFLIKFQFRNLPILLIQQLKLYQINILQGLKILNFL